MSEQISEPISPTPEATLDESWLAEVLDETPGDGAPHQTLALRDDRLVAVTVVAPRRRFAVRQERYSAAAARRAALTGGGLLPLVASGHSEGRMFAAYEVGEAMPLSAYREVEQLTTPRCLQLAWGIARALDAAVSQGVLPCEVTPESVFVKPGGEVALADLGLAREALGNPPPTRDPGAAWVAPELLRGEGPHERSAVYSFGALLYTLLSGAPPHRGTRSEVAKSRPPRLTEIRPDLPPATDLVLATAMARDPLERYASATEARRMADALIQGKAVANTLHPELAPPRRRRVLPERRPGPRPPARVERGAWLVVAAALGCGALAGVLLAGGDDASEPAQPQRVAAGALGVQVPSGWDGAAAGARALEAHPSDDPASGLEVELSEAPVEKAEQATPVLIGRLEAWRSTGGGDQRTIRYVVPTSSGKLVATCAVQSGAGTALLSVCERALSTLRLRGVEPVPLASVAEVEERWRLAAGRLGVDRRTARRRLAGARLPAGQWVAAQALVRVHERAERRFAALPGGEAVVLAARETAAAYRELAAAARRRDRQRFDAARAEVRRSEGELAEAVAAR